LDIPDDFNLVFDEVRGSVYDRDCVEDLPLPTFVSLESPCEDFLVPSYELHELDIEVALPNI
jgi:hypothetical protein